MNLGLAVSILITEPDYLIDAAQDITGKRLPETLALKALFQKSQTSSSFKIVGLEVQGYGSELTLNILAKVTDEKALFEDANEAFKISGGDKVITSPHRAVYELAVASNSNESPDQIGIAIRGARGLSGSECRRVIERLSEPVLGVR